MGGATYLKFFIKGGKNFMKRSRKQSLISGILALSLIMAGTGYAYWTDTLSVTTKATTGDFGVAFVDLGLYAQYGNEFGSNGRGWSIIDGVGDSGYVDEDFFLRGANDYNAIAAPNTIQAYMDRVKGYNNVNFDAKLGDLEDYVQVGPYNPGNANASDEILLTINKMYPGYAQAFRSDIINVGDIAAKLSGIDFEVSALDGKELGNVKDMLGLAIFMHAEMRPGNPGDQDVFKLAANFNDDDIFTVGNVDFVRLSALEKADPAVLSAVLQNQEILCRPTENRMDIYLGVAMDPDAEGVYTTGTTANMKDNNDELSQEKGVQVVIDLLWDQFNVGKGIDAPANILQNQNN